MTSRSSSYAVQVAVRSRNMSFSRARPCSLNHCRGSFDTPTRCAYYPPDGRVFNCNRHLVTLPRAPLPKDSSTTSTEKSQLDISITDQRELSSLLEQQDPSQVQSSTLDVFPTPSSKEALYVSSTANQIPQNSCSHSTPRLIKIERKDVPSEHLKPAVDSASTHYRESLNGYKYRIFKSPLLTNDILSAEVATTSDQAIDRLEPNEYGHYFHEDIHHVPTSIGARPSFPNDINGVLTSRWWKTLYNNVAHPSASQNASTSKTHPFQSASMRNRRASILLEEIISNSQQYQDEEDEKVTARIRVRSVQAASSIDVVAVLSKVFGGGVARTRQYDLNEVDTTKNNSKMAPNNINNPLSEFFASSPPLRHVFGRTNIIIQLSPPPADCPLSLTPSVPRYVAIYRFGSVVFFNVTTKEASKLLEQIKKHSIDPIAVGFERREFFEMGLQPQLETATGVVTADRAMVRELDMNTVGVVSNIMGQTVALDWHNDTVDELLASFSNINTSVERTGNFSSMERHMLFQVVARNNSLFIDMVSKLGIKDRSDTAWHLSQYEGLHYGMREQFDLDERFRHIEFKLDLIQQNAKFFLEVLHAQKSNTLEWVIIVLISFECVLMCLDMSGVGAKFFSDFTYFQ